MNGGQGPSGNDLATYVRNYVHYDNLANNYSKQATGARKLRDEFENKTIQLLRSNNMDNAIIQISGAKLQMGENKTNPTLNVTRLRDYLKKYYAQKGNSVDETESILRFIELQKKNDCQYTSCLKKIPISPQVPAPPPLPPMPPLAGLK
jgi:hypothetical protein